MLRGFVNAGNKARAYDKLRKDLDSIIFEWKTGCVSSNDAMIAIYTQFYTQTQQFDNP